ncbi:MAG: metallophosphoesterase family protein [Planctomycetota bacterium]|jgi:diadenosine tetraphosphatase ApaH/serine/threonine PP2A family protein phosphatase
MRFGILGDIHSNLEALRAVLGAMKEDRVDRFLCLGDIVGYGADPGPCIEMVRALDPVVVGGNHDWAAAGRLDLSYFNAAAGEAILWTQQVLPREDLDWLGSLDLVEVVEGADITVGHGTFHQPELFEYLMTPYDAYMSFRELRTALAFVGHSHVPVAFFDGNPVVYTVEDEIRLDDRRAIANVGSVGQPRDEDPRAAYGIYDDEERTLRLKRVPYDVEGAAARIREVGLPAILGERLYLGR